MPPEFGEHERTTADHLIALAFAEDFDVAGDVTSVALVPAQADGTVRLVARQPGVVAGLWVAEMVFAKLDAEVLFDTAVEDGQTVDTGTTLATVSGPIRPLLAGERTALNCLGHLCGIATLTRRFVDAVAGTNAKIYDTRKTLPGWRLLEKYAVRAGSGCNHRMGLFDAVLIKDNHLAAWAAHATDSSIAAAVRKARESVSAGVPVEVEVDTLDDLRDALGAVPDIVLVDNMDAEMLRRAVAIRNELAPDVELEASGGITLDNVAEIAATGVDRISIGALTHSAPALDVAFDWATS